MRAFLAVAAAGAAVLFVASPARADGAWIEVNPSSIQAGYRVGIRASCEDNLNEASVKSDAFGEIKLLPEYGFLVGAVTIPTDKKAKTYNAKLRCANGSTASTTINVIGMDRPTKGPATGGGGTASDSGAASGLMMAGGAATVAAGLGLLALRRRRASA